MEKQVPNRMTKEIVFQEPDGRRPRTVSREGKHCRYRRTIRNRSEAGLCSVKPRWSGHVNTQLPNQMTKPPPSTECRTQEPKGEDYLRQFFKELTIQGIKLLHFGLRTKEVPKNQICKGLRLFFFFFLKQAPHPKVGFELLTWNQESHGLTEPARNPKGGPDASITDLNKAGKCNIQWFTWKTVI